MATPPISISLPVLPYIRRGLSQFSWKHQDSTFSRTHPEPYLPFPRLSRLKGMGAGLVMFPIRAGASTKSEGGPGVRVVEEVMAPPRRILCSWCTGLSYWIRTPVGRLEARDESYSQLHQLARPWWTVMFTNTSRSLELICRRHGQQPGFHYHHTDP